MAKSAAELHPVGGERRESGRVPPHNLEAEESLLGAMLLSRDAIATAVQTVRADDFYRPAHAHVYDAILALYGNGEPADPVTVAEELRRAGLLDSVGGRPALFQIQSQTPATANAGHYARIIEELSLLRRLIVVAGNIAEMGYDPPDEVPETLDRAEAMVFEVAERRVTDSLVELRDVLQASLDQLEALADRGDRLTGVPSGYLDLDELLLGLQPSALIVVAARPAMGKTSLALGAATHVAQETRRPVMFFSMEMGHLELTQRLLASEAKVDSKKLRRADLNDREWERIAHAVGRLGEAPLYIDDNPHTTVMEMRAKARRTKARHGDLGLIVVDYLQLMSSPNSRAESRQVEVSELSRGLKILARELEAPVMALSQLNRMPEMRQDKRPMLSDLRESGCLTADTTITRADTGERVTLGELLVSGERDIPVFTVDDDYRVVRGHMTHVFSSGVKTVYRLRLRSGMEVKASANHPFLTFDGWRRLDELVPGERLALPRRCPEPSHPTEWSGDEVVLLAHLLAAGRVDADGAVVYEAAEPSHTAVVERAARAFPGHVERLADGETTRVVMRPDGDGAGVAAWLETIGLPRLAREKRSLPPALFGLARHATADFIRHLWAAGGRTGSQGGAPIFTYLATDRSFLADVQQLLLRFGVLSRMRRVEHPGGAAAFELRVTAERSRRRFLTDIGRPAVVPAATSRLARGLVGQEPRPRHATTFRSAMGSTSFPGPSGASGVSGAPGGWSLADGDELHGLVQTDLLWDAVESVEELGPMPVFDATVPGTHNFIADGIVVHNSIEQDADVVAFIYRDDVYHQDSADRGQAEVIVAKHRNGPTGTVRLAFLDHYTKFENMARVD